MTFTFGKGYLCAGCKRRYTKRNSVFVYELSCICKDCYSKFEQYSDTAYFEATGGVEFLTAVFRYKGLYRKIFLDFKFNSQSAYGHILGMAMAERMRNREGFSDYSYIIPVPISKERLNERGYNQSGILARYISEAMDIPILEALKRVRHSAPQSTVENSMRARNVKGAFVAEYRFSGENVIIFDDIYTTGSTAAECAKMLHNAGAGKVAAISGAYNQKVWIDRSIHRFI